MSRSGKKVLSEKEEINLYTTPMQRTFKKGIFDRYDGWRVRNVDAVFNIIPYILRTRVDAQNFVTEDFETDHLKEFIAEHQKDIPGLSRMHVVLAALVRMFSQRPYLNRFVIWNKLFSRNTISIAIAVKRSLTDKGEETLIKPEFEPTDTLADVARKLQEEYELKVKSEEKNGSDKTSKFFGYFPDCVIRFFAFLMRWSDNLGFLPKSIERISPWHCSLFFTNVGSIGTPAIYHHLYEFGTCTIFVAMGRVKALNHVESDGSLSTKKIMSLKFVMDERVCDGHYYATGLRLLHQYILKPEKLLVPPEKVEIDDGVGKPVWIHPGDLLKNEGE